MLQFKDVSKDEKEPVTYVATLLLTLNQEPEPIVEYKVGWDTPKGVLFDLATALQWCTECDLDPNMVLRPVVIAKTKSNWEKL